jgi:hypothetical protein
MKKREWFQTAQGGGLLLFPYSRAGWIVWLVFLTALLASIWLPHPLTKPYLIACSVVYLVISYGTKVQDR